MPPSVLKRTSEINDTPVNVCKQQISRDELAVYQICSLFIYQEILNRFTIHKHRRGENSICLINGFVHCVSWIGTHYACFAHIILINFILFFGRLYEMCSQLSLFVSYRHGLFAVRR